MSTDTGAQELRVEVGCCDGLWAAIVGEAGEDHERIGHRRERLTREDIAHSGEVWRDWHSGRGFAICDVRESQIERAHPRREVLI